MTNKKTLLAVAFAITAALSSPSYAGFPVVDVPSVTQQLITYLTALEELDAQLNQYYNEIEQLKRIEVPGLSIIKRINADIEAYKKTAGRYNELVGKYNSLADALKQFQLVEDTLNSRCATGNMCSKEDVKELNSRKIELIKSLNNMMDESLTYNTEKSAENLKKDYDRLDELTKTNPQTQGELLAKLLEMEAFNAELNIKLREQISKNQAQNLMIKKYEQQFSQEGELRSIGNQRSAANNGNQ